MPYAGQSSQCSAPLRSLLVRLAGGRSTRWYNIAAPAVSGNEMFERVFRVHMNTQEQLVVFLPALWIFAGYISPLWAAGLGAVFIVGRAIYASSYVK